MSFWIGILAAASLAHFAVKIGFYQTWTMLFNIVVSIYLAIFLRSVIAQLIPASAESPNSGALTMIAIAIASFVILHGITYIFFTSQFDVTFPKLFNILFSGFLGFAAGFLIWSFLALLITIAPVSQRSFIKTLGFSTQALQTNTKYLTWWCDKLNNIVAAKTNQQTTKEAIAALVKADSKKNSQPPKTDNPQTTPPQEKNIIEPPPQSNQATSANNETYEN